MRTRWIIAACAALAVAALLWSTLERRPRLCTPAADEPPGTAQEKSEPASALAQPPERTPAAVEVRGRLAPAPAPDPRLCEIRGRFVLPGGVPAAGMAFEVHGWESNDEDVRKYGRPEHWEDLAGATDADGRFSVRFDPPRAYQFALEAKTPGYAGAEWRWSEILAGEVVDLGEVELVGGGIVEGRIVDADGNVVPGHWYVYARSIGLREFEGREETQVTTWADPVTGRFHAEDVMPGRVELSANDSDWTEEAVIQVRSGETVEADILVKSRETSRRITLDASSRLLRTVSPERERVTLTGADGVPRTPKSSRFPFGDIVFDDVEPGQYRLAIDDPRFEPWSCTVRPGAEVQAELEGTSALELRVRGPDGEPIQHYALRVQLRNVTFSPNEFEVPEETTYLLEGFLGGLTPGDYRITVSAGDLLGAIDLDGLGLGETRAIEVMVGSGSVVSGRVQYSDGEPAAGIDVALLPSEPSGPQPELWKWSVAERVLFEEDVEKGTTDERGSFRFVLALPGEYLVYASTAHGSEAVSEALVLGPNTSRDGLELVLPRGGFVAGRILAPPGASCAGLRVWIGMDKSFRAHGSVSETARELGADGRFELGPIPPGPMTAYLLLPIQTRRMGKGSISSSGGLSNHVVLGTIEVVDGERIERDFEVPEFPGTVALSVLVNGEAIAGVGIELSRSEVSNQREAQVVYGETVDGVLIDLSNGVDERRFEVTGETDARGQFGPALAFPGSWRVSLRDPDLGWRYEHPNPVLVAAASESRALVSVQVTEASLVFLDAESGAPLAERSIALLGPPGDWTAEYPLLHRKTDAGGRASWTLASGEYRFRLESRDEEFWFFPDPEASVEKARTAPIVWTSEGPLTREVRL